MLLRLALFSSILFCSAVYAQSEDVKIPEEVVEVQIGIDKVEKLKFPFSPKIQIGNEQVLNLAVSLKRREITFKGLKRGKTSVLIPDQNGEYKLKYIVNVVADGKSQQVSELRELLEDVEGIEIGIKGGKVFVGGQIVVPEDIGKLTVVLASYPEVLRLIEMSPQTQRFIAQKMMDEFVRNNMRNVTVRIVNKTFWLEGVVNSESKKTRAMAIAKAYLPDGLESLSSASDRLNEGNKNKGGIVDLIAVNAKAEQPPPPKQVKIITQFVELKKDYSRTFGFRWTPLMGADNSQIQFGQNQQGGLTTSQSGTLSGTISNLFPKLESMRNAGYARVIQSGMVVTKDKQAASISKSTQQQFALGTGEFSQPASSEVKFNVSITPQILAQEKVELALGAEVGVPTGRIGNQIVVTKNNISTKVVVKSKDSAAIGGIVQNSTVTDYDKGSPGGPLPDGAQPLFNLIRTKGNSIDKSQFVIFITPEILSDISEGTEEIRRKFKRRKRF